jgi:glycosyltransferase involved in cell wall biosynthesis
MSAPKISVLMPTYNTQEAHLREAIESILSQTFSDFEFIILDDCSTNVDVEKIVRSYQDNRIIFAKNDANLGISGSRNRLVEMSKGEYLAVADHDDISASDRFMKQANFLDNHPDVGVVSGLVDVIETGKLLCNDLPENDIEQHLLMECYVCHPASMIRKSVLIDNNVRYESRYTPSEDYALWCNLIGKTKFHNITAVLLHYRDHKDNTTHRQSSRMAETAFVIQNETRQKFPILWELAKFNSCKIRKVKLFGILPLLKTVERRNKIKYYLFNCILIMKVTTKFAKYRNKKQ